ncbi:hypothetical protein HQ520_11115 [bacterium]|nr:hypothetical protein [bacterium]
MDEGPQTVEQLITDGYFAVPAGEPETAILHDRKHTAWLGLDDILGQVRHRQEIHEQNIHEIEWAQCYAFNEMARGGWPYSEEQRCAFEKRSQELHAQQRDERIALWRDLSKLRLLVPESAQQYLSAFRRTEILDDCEGDLL